MRKCEAFVAFKKLENQYHEISFNWKNKVWEYSMFKRMQYNVDILCIANKSVKWYKYFEKQFGIIL